jgi:hypothetical protein
VRRLTIRKRMRSKLQEIKQQLRPLIPCDKLARGSGQSCKATSTTTRYRETSAV